MSIIASVRSTIKGSPVLIAVIVIERMVSLARFFFFFQAEDGIRDLIVTGVQTCALPIYFILYEAARLATITRGAYLERLNNPTPWSRKMMPHHRNMVRSLCRVRATFGSEIGRASCRERV